jgi:putative phosphoribosyl transferase
MPFIDRVEAGRRLARELEHLRGHDVVVLGLPRGGVPVAFEVAAELRAPLDVLLVRKLGVPFQPELAMGAIGEESVRVLNDEVLAIAAVTTEELERVEARERQELARRVQRYRAGRPTTNLQGRTAIIVDDGMATGSTALAACAVSRALGAHRIVLALPVAPTQAVEAARRVADEVVCLETPAPFFGVGQWYHDFTQVSDDTVIELLHRAARRPDEPSLPHGFAIAEHSADCPVKLDMAGVVLQGDLLVPEGASGIVVFAHGSGSSRHSPRNRSVAQVLNRAGCGTLLFDLLTLDEERRRENVFDVALLGARLRAAVEWLRLDPALAKLPVGLFGASTGAAAALWTAAEPDARIAAVVSRGGRPDLAAARLPVVIAPTLLIVGGNDDIVLRLNEEAAQRMRCERHISVVPGATHLFEEPGALDAVARLARDWFVAHFVRAENIARHS